MRYVLSGEFKPLEEKSGTVVNISGFEAEISTSGEARTGIILYPRQRFSFNDTIYAARAPGEVGIPVIATIPLAESGSGSTSEADETITDDDINAIFDGNGFDQTDGDEVVSDDDIYNLFK